MDLYRLSLAGCPKHGSHVASRPLPSVGSNSQRDSRPRAHGLVGVSVHFLREVSLSLWADVGMMPPEFLHDGHSAAGCRLYQTLTLDLVAHPSLGSQLLSAEP